MKKFFLAIWTSGLLILLVICMAGVIFAVSSGSTGARGLDDTSEIDEVWTIIAPTMGLSGKVFEASKDASGEYNGSGNWVDHSEKYDVVDEEDEADEENLGMSYSLISDNVGNLDLLEIMTEISTTKALISTTEASRTCACGAYCDKYAYSLNEYSHDYGVDPLLSLAVMMVESNCKQSVAASSASAVGAMQIGDYGPNGGYEKYNGVCTNRGPKVSSHSELIGELNYDNNIHCGVIMLSEEYAYTQTNYPDGALFTCTDTHYTEWAMAVRYYNGWIGESLCDKSHNKAQWNYVENVFMVYNGLVAIYKT